MIVIGLLLALLGAGIFAAAFPLSHRASILPKYWLAIAPVIFLVGVYYMVNA